MYPLPKTEETTPHMDIPRWSILKSDWLCSLQPKMEKLYQIRSDQISRSVLSDSSWPHELQHARPPCPSPTPRVHWDSCPSSQWCHPAISSRHPLLLLPPIPPSIRVFSNESFPMSLFQPFAWGAQSTGVSASAWFLPKKSQGWSPSEWTGWISLQSKGHSRVFSNTTVQSISSSALSLDNT